MKIKALILCAAAVGFTAAGVFAQPRCSLRPSETVFLYATDTDGFSDTVKGDKFTFAGFRMEEDNGYTVAENLGKGGELRYVSKFARLDLYFPEKPNGQMIVSVPGGAYAFVASYNEGVYTADWMTRQGITVAVLKYRLPNTHPTVPLEDVQNAFRYCRAHAAEWGVNNIGIIGFSAGGHLAASASTLFVDDITRPDFSVLVYPVIDFDIDVTHKGTRFNLIGSDEDWLTRKDGEKRKAYSARLAKHDALVEYYSLQKRVSDRTPPTFLVLSDNDGAVIPANSIGYYNSLKAHGIPAEMHIYPYGGHGWGFTVKAFGNDPVDALRGEIFASLARWLKMQNKRP